MRTEQNRRLLLDSLPTGETCSSSLQGTDGTALDHNNYVFSFLIDVHHASKKLYSLSLSGLMGGGCWYGDVSCSKVKYHVLVIVMCTWTPDVIDNIFIHLCNKCFSEYSTWFTVKISNMGRKEILGQIPIKWRL